MTKRKAKSLSLKVWRYLRDHPEISEKSGLPKELFDQIKNLECECPLCEYFERGNDACEGCPLDDGDYQPCGPDSFNVWDMSDYNGNPKEDRARGAGRLVERLEKWEVK